MAIFGNYDSNDFLLFMDGCVGNFKSALLKKNNSSTPLPLSVWNGAYENYESISKI